MGITPKADRPRTLAEAYALAASRGALRPWTIGAELPPEGTVLDLRTLPAQEPAAERAQAGTGWPALREADEPPRPIDPPWVDVRLEQDLPEEGPAPRPRRATGANLAIAAGVVLIGIAAWNLGRDDPLPAAGTPAAETTTTVARSTSTSATSAVTTSTAVVVDTTALPPTTAAQVAPTGPATRPGTPTTRRPTVTAPPRTTSTTSTTVAPTSTTAVTTETTPTTDGSTTSTAPEVTIPGE